jgi:TetR/AcrR family transcriptional regulator, cholesterol catabolism regulator
VPYAGLMALSVNRDTLTRNQAARRERVLDAATALATEGGYDAVQMREVAAKANVALGTIYRYFSSKDHLLAACQVRWSEQTEQALQKRPARGSRPVERVVDVLRRATRAAERKPLLIAALVTATTSPDPAVSECQEEITEITQRTLLSVMDDVDPDRRVAVVRILEHVWVSCLLGWVNSWRNVRDVGDELEMTARLLLD